MKVFYRFLMCSLALAAAPLFQAQQAQAQTTEVIAKGAKWTGVACHQEGNQRFYFKNNPEVLVERIQGNKTTYQVTVYDKKGQETDFLTCEHIYLWNR